MKAVALLLISAVPAAAVAQAPDTRVLMSEDEGEQSSRGGPPPRRAR